MTPPAVFGLSVLMSFVAFGIVTRLYIWPRLRSISREDALVALTVPHTFPVRWAELSGPGCRIALAAIGFRRSGGLRRSGGGHSRHHRNRGALRPRSLGHCDCVAVQRLGYR